MSDVRHGKGPLMTAPAKPVDLLTIRSRAAAAYKQGRYSDAEDSRNMANEIEALRAGLREAIGNVANPEAYARLRAMLPPS